MRCLKIVCEGDGNNEAERTRRGRDAQKRKERKEVGKKETPSSHREES
jgi:hypothetical protein